MSSLWIGRAYCHMTYYAMLAASTPHVFRGSNDDTGLFYVPQAWLVTTGFNQGHGGLFMHSC